MLGPRQDYLSWDDYFMALAQLTAQRSKDPETQVGSCIVDGNNHIIGIGYNGFPNNIENTNLPWDRNNEDPLLNKYLYIVHSEINAIANSDHTKLSGSRLYATLAPCNGCAQLIIQSGIKEVIYLDDKHAAKPAFIAGKKLLDLAGIMYRQYTPSTKEITIKF